MVQYLADDCGILNAGDDVQGCTNAVGAWMRRNGHLGRSTADSAGFHVNLTSGRLLLVHTRLSRCPQVIARDGMYASFAGARTGHRHMTLRECFLIRICCNFPDAPASPGWPHPRSVFAVRYCQESRLISSFSRFVSIGCRKPRSGLILWIDLPGI